MKKKEKYEFYLKPGDIVKKVYLEDFEDQYENVLWLVLRVDDHPIYPLIDAFPLNYIPQKIHTIKAYYNSTISISESWQNPTHAFTKIS